MSENQGEGGMVQAMSWWAGSVDVANAARRCKRRRGRRLLPRINPAGNGCQQLQSLL